MAQLSKASVIGNLGKDPEVRYTQTNQKVVNFSLAVDAGRDQTYWVAVSAWGKLGETVERLLRKGDSVYVDGRLVVREYEHQGQKRYSVDISADTVQKLSGRREDQGAPAAAPAEAEADEEGVEF